MNHLDLALTLTCLTLGGKPENCRRLLLDHVGQEREAHARPAAEETRGFTVMGLGAWGGLGPEAGFTLKL